MKFSTLQKKIEILKLRNLYIKHENENIQIYINPDRTYNERIKQKKLLEELKTRREAGEENILIRNGKIMKALPFRFDPQSDWG